MDAPRITAVRHELLTLHRVLIEAARVELERIEGRLTPNQMLDRLMADERLAWVHPLTELIVGLDEALEGEAPYDVEACVIRARRLLTPDDPEAQTHFSIEYLRLLHERPEVTMAHASAMRVLA